MKGTASKEYELEYIGGPYAGKMIHRGVNDYVDGCFVEVQGTWDEHGLGVSPCFVYRYKNGAFHYLDQSEKPVVRLVYGKRARLRKPSAKIRPAVRPKAKP